MIKKVKEKKKSAFGKNTNTRTILTKGVQP